ncbi:MAG TPA: hypothetical protein ENG66_07010 [Thermococcus sp.]|nr:hypothetical protein [Thermococcus sp.]
MAEDVIKTLNENFFYSKKQRGYTFKHIYEKHIIGDISKKTGKMPFTLSEVLRAEKEGKLLIYGRDLIALWETDDKRYLYVILRKKDLRIVTAYRIGRKQYLKILKY